MPRNVEIKAKLVEIAPVLERARALTERGPETIRQDDTFFACERGRLKLRAFEDGSGELIFYARADRAGPKESFYLISKTTEPDALRATLTAACGITGRVQKERVLLLIGRTRVHLDQVVGLGEFLELEVVLHDGEEVASGEREAHSLLEALGVRREQLIETAYVDLLRANGKA